MPQSTFNQDWWKSLWNTQATLIYLAWYGFCIVSWAVLPGDRLQGTTLRTGVKKTYKINTFATFLLALGLTLGAIHHYGPESFTFTYEKWIGFVAASVLMSFAQAMLCYTLSFREGTLHAIGGNSGNFIYDFFIGRELNPSFGSFDLKSFNELRPGMILWALIDISMLCEQATRHGGLNKVTDSMWLVSTFQILYVADAVYNERAVFTTIDIITDSFSFMLAIAFTWVPFTCLPSPLPRVQARRAWSDLDGRDPHCQPHWLLHLQRF